MTDAQQKRLKGLISLLVRFGVHHTDLNEQEMTWAILREGPEPEVEEAISWLTKEFPELAVVCAAAHATHKLVNDPGVDVQRINPLLKTLGHIVGSVVYPLYGRDV